MRTRTACIITAAITAPVAALLTSVAFYLAAPTEIQLQTQEPQLQQAQSSTTNQEACQLFQDASDERQIYPDHETELKRIQKFNEAAGKAESQQLKDALTDYASALTDSEQARVDYEQISESLSNPDMSDDERSQVEATANKQNEEATKMQRTESMAQNDVMRECINTGFTFR